MTTENSTTFDQGVAVETHTVTVAPEVINAGLVANAYTTDLANLQGVLAQADVPAGTLTTAQLSNFVRTAQANQRLIARALIHLARLVRGDFSGVE